mmetsp:Transcript_27379/g.49361  ORF Transcript_27379/g.49361 Transcript_27379/m.49361 type:complete len:224 (+) Transcript_27379:1388-2059(+)
MGLPSSSRCTAREEAVVRSTARSTRMCLPFRVNPVNSPPSPRPMAMFLLLTNCSFCSSLAPAASIAAADPSTFSNLTNAVPLNTPVCRSFTRYTASMRPNLRKSSNTSWRFASNGILRRNRVRLASDSSNSGASFAVLPSLESFFLVFSLDSSSSSSSSPSDSESPSSSSLEPEPSSSLSLSPLPSESFSSFSLSLSVPLPSDDSLSSSSSFFSSFFLSFTIF